MALVSLIARNIAVVKLAHNLLGIVNGTVTSSSEFSAFQVVHQWALMILHAGKNAAVNLAVINILMVAVIMIASYQQHEFVAVLHVIKAAFLSSLVSSSHPRGYYFYSIILSIVKI